MLEFLSRLFDTGDSPARWTTGHGWLHVLADLAVWGACTAIPVALAYFITRRHDLPVRRVFWLIAAFIFAAGITHLMEAVLFWWPAYRFAGLVKLMTAVLSWAAVIALVTAVPSALRFRSPSQLEDEVAARGHELARADDDLRRREEVLGLAIGAGRMAVWDHDLVTGRVTWSGEASAVFGAPPANLGDSFGAFLALIHPDDRGRVDAVISAAVAAGLDHETEFRVVWPNGSVRWVAGRGRVLRDAAGRAVRVVGVGTDITRRRADEEALRQSEREAQEARRRVVRVLEGMTDAYLAVDRDWRVTYVNAAAERGTRPRDELLGRDYFALFPDLAGTEFERQYRRSMTERVAVEFESYYAPAAAWIEVKAQPGEDGGLSIFYRDVTARKQFEADLRAGDARFAAVIDNSPAAIFVKDADGRHQLVNRVFALAAGCTPADLVGRTDAEVFAPDVAERFHRTDQEILASGRAQTFEETFDLHGRRLTFLTTKFPLLDAAGRPYAVCGIATDVTDRREAERALKLFRQRLDLVVRGTDVGLWYCDLPFDRLDWNARCKEHFGLPPDAPVTIDTFYERLHPADREQTRRAIDRAITDRSLFDVEYRTVTPDGRERWLRAIGRVFYDDAGTPIRFDGITLDVTTGKRSEAELHARATALAEADRRKDEFLAMLAHELRNPLAPIRNAVQIMQMVEPTDDQQRYARDVIRRQVASMGRLVDDLLDVSRITRSKIALRKEPADLGDIIRRSVETSRPLIDGRKHALTVTIVPGPLPVEGDVTRLAQVLANLLNNAAKYTEEGGRIALTVTRDGREAVVRVRDTGVGIPPDLLPNVFDLFTQAERTLDRAQGGLGIGLSLVRSLVEMHGGRVEAHSGGPGLGSEFVVRLPLREAEPVMADTIVEPVDLTMTPPPTKLKKVLVVDDNVDAAKSLALLLQAAGYLARVAHTGPGAVKAAEKFRPDLAVLDIGLPGMDGYEVARALRASAGDRSLLLVAVTGYGGPDARQKAAEAGFDHHLVKPVDPDELQALLRGELRPEAPGVTGSGEFKPLTS